MRPTLSRLSISVVLGAALLPAGCWAGKVLQMEILPPGDRTGMPQALRCAPLAAAEPVRMPADGKKEVVIRYPEKDPVAILTVPQRAVEQPTIFTLSAPAATQRVLVVVTASDTTGKPVTEFTTAPLRLMLNLRDDCTPRRPTSRDSSFFVYRFSPSDSTFDTYGGTWDDAHAWEVLWQRTARVRTDLDHLSGYILAQGRKPPE